MNGHRDPRGEPWVLRETPEKSAERMVLVAEDDEPIGEAIILLLEDEGYRPVWVTNGKEALEAARRHWPDVVLTDHMMPEMNGLELIEALRARATADSRPMPRVVLMTAAASSDVGSVAELRQAGIDAVVSKPFDATDLLALVTRLIEEGSPHEP